MKTLGLTLLALTLITLSGCSGCAKSEFQPLPGEQIDQVQKQNAERVALRTLSGWRDGRFEPLSEDFTQQMIDALPARAQREAYDSIKGMFGDFQSLEFVEAVASAEIPNMIVYRFRGTFTEASAKPEIRVVMDGRGRVAGFWCKPWSRTMR